MNRPVKVAIAIYGTYIALSLLVVLPLLNYMVPKLVTENLQRPFHAEIILFNPFTLALEVRGARLSEANGEAFAAAITTVATGWGEVLSAPCSDMSLSWGRENPWSSVPGCGAGGAGGREEVARV